MDGTIVDYLYEPNGPTPFKCGYCKAPDTSMIEGVLAHRMTCQDFQDLVDRGFQRSGKFIYRPFMKRTCCPQYVFRTNVTKFRLSKQQRATIRKMNKYLIEGHGCEDGKQSEGERPSSDTVTIDSGPSKTMNKPSKPVRPGLGADPSKPQCKKAKVLRKERKAKKAAEKHVAESSEKITTLEKKPTAGITSADQMSQSPRTTHPSSSATVEEWQDDKIAVPQAPSYAHEFTTRLVSCAPCDSQFIETYEESYTVFRKFQLGVHTDSEEDCRETNFNEFLVESPLTQEKAPEGSPCDYGSYHLQYLIDGKIFAVGVLDIIPKGVLCEYLYYDPAYRFIAPGVYSALYEISLAQRFYRVNPEMQFYYMGFYVQSCPKMNYKRHYISSELLCPETHCYVPLPQCIPRLKETEYCRLDDHSPIVNEEVTEEFLDELNIIYQGIFISYKEYRAENGTIRDKMIRAYVQLVGLKVASRTTLHILDM